MSNRMADIILTIDRSICGHAIALPSPETTSIWVVLVNAVLLALAVLITVGCIAAAIYFVIRPGEKNPDHPKYSILNADR